MVNFNHFLDLPPKEYSKLETILNIPRPESSYKKTVNIDEKYICIKDLTDSEIKYCLYHSQVVHHINDELTWRKQIRTMKRLHNNNGIFFKE